MARRTKDEKPEVERKRRQSSTIADWGSQDGNLLREIISAVTMGDGAIRFGYTRDGGAYSIGIYGDGKPFTEFCPGSSDVTGWLEGIKDDYS